MSEHQGAAVSHRVDPARIARRGSAAGQSWAARLLPSGPLGWLVLVFIVAALFSALIYAPTEATMGDVQRIFYFHVPSAWVGFLSFGIVFVASIQWLRTKRPWWDALAASAAEVGVMFTTVALVTGSIWAKPTWGTWWDWDPRLTTTLILWLVYVSYAMLRSMVENPAKRASLAAVVGILGFIDVPVVFMSIRWWRTIHPVVISGAGMDLDPSMVTTLMICLTTFTLLQLHILRLRLHLELQRDDARRLRDLILED